MTSLRWIPLSSLTILVACSTASSGPPDGGDAAGAGGSGETAGASGKDSAGGDAAGGAGKSGASPGTGGSAGEAGAGGSSSQGGAPDQGGAAGTSGAAGGGGACTLVAKYSSKDSFCNACAESKCCAEVNGCLGDTRCNDDYVNCQLACALLPDDEDPAAIEACLAKCDVDHPEGKQLYEAAIGCVETKCAGICE